MQVKMTQYWKGFQVFEYTFCPRKVLLRNKFITTHAYMITLNLQSKKKKIIIIKLKALNNEIRLH